MNLLKPQNNNYLMFLFPQAFLASKGSSLKLYKIIVTSTSWFHACAELGGDGSICLSFE